MTPWNAVTWWNFSKDDERKEYYFTMAPETDMAAYRNIHLGKWEKDVKGWRYQYQGEYLTSWQRSMISGIFLAWMDIC